MGWPKGKPRPPGAGRKKGTKNKVSGDLRQYVINVADQLEAEGKGLKEWANGNPNDFWSKVFKGVVPTNLNVNHAGGVDLRTLSDSDLRRKLEETERTIQKLERKLRTKSSGALRAEEETGDSEVAGVLPG